MRQRHRARPGAGLRSEEHADDGAPAATAPNTLPDEALAAIRAWIVERAPAATRDTCRAMGIARDETIRAADAARATCHCAHVMLC
jgi:hypothetical protein